MSDAWAWTPPAAPGVVDWSRVREIVEEEERFLASLTPEDRAFVLKEESVRAAHAARVLRERGLEPLPRVPMQTTTEVQMDDRDFDEDELEAAAVAQLAREQEERDEEYARYALGLADDRDERYPNLNIVSVAEVMRAGAQPPVMLIEYLLPVGVHATVYGPKENGKTWLVLAACVAPLLKRGRTVVYIDKEMSRTAIAERLSILGVDAETVERHLVYLELPRLVDSDSIKKEWNEMLARERPALVLADASAGVLADAGLDENRTPDVLRWDSWYFENARRAGATTLMLDHTGHGSKGRARGASGKGAAAKVELEVECKERFDRATVGVLYVTRQKNSLAADIPERQGYELGGTPFTFERMPDSRVPSAEPEDEGSAAARRAGLLGSVREVIERAGDEGISATGVYDLKDESSGERVVRARKQDVLAACKDLEDSKDSPVTKTARGRYFVPAEHRAFWNAEEAS